MSLLAFLRRFPDDDSCWAHLEAARWPERPVCPRCGGTRSHAVGRPHYRRCTDCRKKFTVAHGTPFEGTHLPLRVWFTALYRYDRYAAAVAHTNTGESFNATIKRAIIGVWHWFSNKHTDRYLTEIAFRWNERKAATAARIDTMLRICGPRLRLRELTA